MSNRKLITTESLNTILPVLKNDIEKSVQPDWNQSDNTQVGYIKNRTHWEDKTTSVIIEEQRILGFYLMEDPIYCAENPFEMTPVIGQTYIVTWDGISYDVTMQVLDGLGYMGNRNYVNMIPGGDIPFAIIFADGNIYVTTESPEESHTMSIATMQTVVHKLDSKFLPDGVWSEQNKPLYETELTDYILFEGTLPKGTTTVIPLEYEIPDGSIIEVYRYNDLLGSGETPYMDVSESMWLEFDNYEHTLVIYSNYSRWDEFKIVLKKLIVLKPFPINENLRQIDWEQNDSTATNYIKNKPFYDYLIDETIVYDNNLVFLQDETRPSTGNYLPVDGVNKWVNDDVLVIVWNNEEFWYTDLDSKALDVGWSYEFGNLNINDDTKPYTNEPFYLYLDGEYGVSIMRDNSSSSEEVHLVIKKMSRKFKQIDEKFIPDSIFVNADWTEDDESSKSYIKNKPVYQDQDGNVYQATGEKLATEQYVNDVKNHIILRDEINGFDYVVSMRDGNIISYCTTDHIEVSFVSSDQTYIVNEPFDASSIIVTAIAKNGDIREIATYAYDEIITEDNIHNFIIRYAEGNNIFEAQIDLHLRCESLIDFDYTINDDGTCTLTAWKGTYRGEPSTRIVVPNSELIIM